MKLLVSGLLVGILLTSSPASAARVSCYCYYNGKEEWKFLDVIRFAGDRSNYKQRGQKACLDLAKRTVLDEEWDGRVTIDHCLMN